MRNLLLLSVLLLGAFWAVAQNAPSQSPAGAGGETTVQGCLSGSAGNFTLTDKNGNTFQLTGDAAKLSEHVGHEIAVTGTTSSASASPDAGADSSKGGQASGSSQQAIEVSSVKHLSKTCQKGASH